MDINIESYNNVSNLKELAKQENNNSEVLVVDQPKTLHKKEGVEHNVTNKAEQLNTHEATKKHLIDILSQSNPELELHEIEALFSSEESAITFGAFKEIMNGFDQLTTSRENQKNQIEATVATAEANEVENVSFRDELITQGYKILGDSIFAELSFPQNEDNPNPPDPEFGWKIHVSPKGEGAEKTFKALQEYLIDNKIKHKVVHSDEHYSKMNSGEYGSTQPGKYITIYPPMDEQPKEEDKPPELSLRAQRLLFKDSAKLGDRRLMETRYNNGENINTTKRITDDITRILSENNITEGVGVENEIPIGSNQLMSIRQGQLIGDTSYYVRTEDGSVQRKEDRRNEPIPDHLINQWNEINSEPVETADVS